MSGDRRPSATVAPSAGGGGGLFNRRPHDKRFVRHVTSLQHQPSNWLPMDAQEFECKLMEVRKYSAEYYDIDSKFRRPNLQLISAYVVQNPYLMGSFYLRKDQMQLQLSSSNNSAKTTVKEKHLYYPTTYRNLELVVRNNFVADWESGKRTGFGNYGVRFWSNSELANNTFTNKSNPRVMIVARVLTGVTVEVEEDHHHNSSPKRPPYFNEDGQVIDTFTTHKGTCIHKFNANELYPDQVLIYRDVSQGEDVRNSRLTDVIKFCQLSYRAGTRFNPDEMTFEGKRNDGKKSKGSTAKPTITQQPRAAAEAKAARRNLASDRAKEPGQEQPLIHHHQDDNIVQVATLNQQDDKGEKSKKIREE